MREGAHLQLRPRGRGGGDEVGEEDPLPVDRLLHGWLAGSLACVGVVVQGEGGGGEVGGCGGELNCWLLAVALLLWRGAGNVAAGKSRRRKQASDRCLSGGRHGHRQGTDWDQEIRIAPGHADQNILALPPLEALACTFKLKYF